MCLNLFGFAFKPRPQLLSFALVSRENPVVSTVNLLASPIDAEILLGCCAVLSFIPITLGYSLTHDVVTSISQSSTQILLILLCTAVLFTGYVKFRWDTGTAGILSVGIGAAQMLAVLHSPSVQKNYVMPLAFPFFLMIGPIAMSLAKRMQISRNGEQVARVANVLLGFFFIECVTRFAFSPFVRERLNLASFGSQQFDADRLYRYKQSLFFSDSNSAGLALLCLTAVLLVFRKHIGRRQLLLAYILLAATLSRASIAAAVCQLAVYRFWRWRRWILMAIIFAAPVLIFLLFTSYSTQEADSVVALDGSFASKFMILQKMVIVYTEADTLQRFLGIGAGNTEGLIGIAAHNIVAVFVLEFGFIGSLMVSTYVWLLSRRSSLTFYLLIIPIVINGFSLYLTSTPFFYLTLGALGAVRDPQKQRFQQTGLTAKHVQAGT